MFRNYVGCCKLRDVECGEEKASCKKTQKEITNPGKVWNLGLKNCHPQDFAYPETPEEATSDFETELPA